MKRAILVYMVWVVAVSAVGPARAANRWWVGGALSARFGDVTFVAIEPVVGYRATKRVGFGMNLIWRHRDDDRFTPTLKSTDYGAGLFTRVRLVRPVFAQVEYEYLSFEVLFPDGTTDRRGYDSLWGGLGISEPTGKRSSVFTTIQYNFLYDSGEPAPYDDAWRLRVGAAFGF